MRFVRYLLILSSLFIFSAASLAEELNSDNWTPRDNDLRILQINVDRYRLEDVLPAYQRKDYLLIPLGYTAEILDLAIDVDIGTGIASGFAFNEDNTFYLDTSRNEAILKGVSKHYNKHLVYVLDDDIYVDATLLSKWLGITVNANLFGSSIKFTSEKPFPFILRMEREEKIAKTRARQNLDTVAYPRHYEPYDMLNMPFIDQTIETSSRHKDSDTTHTVRSTTYLTSDLLGMEASAYMFLANDNSLNDYRFTMGKKDDEAVLLGIAQATEYAIGFITEPSLKNITVPGDQEPGALISNFKLNRQAEYDRHRFIGNLLPGWEVELYHNDRLIGYQSTPVDGQYDFQDIPLLYGRNYFRLVFYGPQGQVEEQEQYFEVGQSLTKKGEHYYRGLVSDNENGGNRATIQYDLGLSNKISASFIGVSIPLDISKSTFEQHNYVQAGLRGFWDAFYVSVDLIDDIDGGEAINLDMQTGIDNTMIRFNHISMSHFFSEEYRITSEEYKSNTEVRLDSTIPPSFLPRIPFSLELIMSDFVSGNDRKELINTLSLQSYGVSLSNQLTYIQNSAQQNQFTGTFGISSFVKNYSLRGTVNYMLQPRNEITNIDMTLRPPTYKNFQLNYGLNHSLVENVTEVNASASKAIGDYTLSLGASYSTNDIITLDARFSIGIGQEPRKKKWQSRALAIAGRGSVSARVFLDNNQDGIFNEDDIPLENIGFTINSGYQNIKTDKDGIAFITGLAEHVPASIAIKKSTLEDPLWDTVLEGMRIVPRPGQAMQLDFPVFISGEIDGTIYLIKNDKMVPVGRVKVEIVDQKGQVVRSASTEYDGFYIISNIPLGTYSVRIAPEQLDTLKLKSKITPAFKITADDQFKSGVDFKLYTDSR